MPGQAPRVDPGDGGQAVADEKALEPFGGAPVGGSHREIAHHDAPAKRLRRLVVLGVGAVVADVGVGERHDLPGVGGIRDDLLIAAHGGVEHELPRGDGDGRAGGLAREDRPIGGHQQGRMTLVLVSAVPRHRAAHRWAAHRWATASITTGSPRRIVCRTAPVKVRPAYGVLRLRLASCVGSTTVDAVGSNTQRFAVAPSSIGPPWALWPARRASVDVRPAMRGRLGAHQREDLRRREQG